jgi:hypothetical protein
MSNESRQIPLLMEKFIADMVRDHQDVSLNFIDTEEGFIFTNHLTQKMWRGYQLGNRLVIARVESGYFFLAERDDPYVT